MWLGRISRFSFAYDLLIVVYDYLQQTADEQTYISLLETHLKSNAFYYSYTYDITHTIQRSHQQLPSSKLWQRVCGISALERMRARAHVLAFDNLSLVP